MGSERPTIKQILNCFATCSIGSSSDPLPKKLEAISSAGFQSIELSFPDLLAYASSIVKKEVDPQDFDTLCTVGRQVKSLCEDLRLKILMLQPFANFEGWPAGSKERDDAFRRAEGWVKIMHAVGTDMLQVGSSDSPSISTDTNLLASDLRQLCDMLSPHNFRIAYENWCWSTHAPTWKSVWSLVQLVNRPNIGLCLDTFQTAGSEWADPTTASGLIEAVPRHDLEEKWKQSMRELSKTVSKENIYLLQISDAYRPTPEPLDKKEDESGLRPRGRWSHDYRPMPFNGGYLPVVDVTKAVLKTGFRGYFSVEVFDGGEDGKGKSLDADLPDFARECREKLDQLLEESVEA